MDRAPRDRAGLLVVRARMEGHDQRLIVRLSYTGDVTDEPMTMSVRSSIDDTCMVVREWLEAFARGGSSA
jgi:hypothetical protein